MGQWDTFVFRAPQSQSAKKHMSDITRARDGEAKRKIDDSPPIHLSYRPIMEQRRGIICHDLLINLIKIPFPITIAFTFIYDQILLFFSFYSNYKYFITSTNYYIYFIDSCSFTICTNIFYYF